MSNIALVGSEVPEFAGGYVPFGRLIVLDRKFLEICERYDAYVFIYETFEHETIHEVIHKLEGWHVSKSFDLVEDEFDLMRREVDE